MPASPLLIDKSHGIVTLTLNRPASLNALSRELVANLTTAFEELANDRDTRVVILTGEGRAFSSGVDLKELGTFGVSAGEKEPAADVDAIRAMARVPQPIIGAINGFAVTGGFELALGCDLLIASSEARFADTHARVGILPGWGLSQRLSRAIGIYRAKEVSLTGNYIDAVRAYDWGLVSRVVEPSELMSTCVALANDMLSCDPELLVRYKRVIDDGFSVPFGKAMELEIRRSMEHMKHVTREQLAATGGNVQQRGRQQSRDA
jgi:enoyl-CoA hydratase